MLSPPIPSDALQLDGRGDFLYGPVVLEAALEIGVDPCRREGGPEARRTLEVAALAQGGDDAGDHGVARPDGARKPVQPLSRVQGALFGEERRPVPSHRDREQLHPPRQERPGGTDQVLLRLNGPSGPCRELAPVWLGAERLDGSVEGRFQRLPAGVQHHPGAEAPELLGQIRVDIRPAPLGQAPREGDDAGSLLRQVQKDRLQAAERGGVRAKAGEVDVGRLVAVHDLHIRARLARDPDEAVVQSLLTEHPLEYPDVVGAD